MSVSAGEQRELRVVRRRQGGGRETAAERTLRVEGLGAAQNEALTVGEAKVRVRSAMTPAGEGPRAGSVKCFWPADARAVRGV